MDTVYPFIMLAVTLAVAVITCARALKRGCGAFQALYYALFFIALYMAFLMKLNENFPAVNAFIPCYKLFSISEYGYASILSDLLAYAAPYILAGLLLIPAFPRFGMFAAFGTGVIVSLIFNVYPLFNGASFVTDEYLAGGLGLALGASVYTVLAYLLKKRLPFDKLKLPVPTHRRFKPAIILAVAVYLGIALIMVFDYGKAYDPVQFFESATPLPESITLDCELSDVAERVKIYVPSTQSVEERAAAIAYQFEMYSAVSVSDGIYTVEGDSQKLTMTESGSWVYESTAVPEGALPSAESAETTVLDFFSEHLVLTVELDEVTDVVERMDSSGALEGYDVYCSMKIGDCPIIGSSTIVASVKRGNTITKIRRYDGDVLAGKSISIVSEKKAYERYLAGECAYTLFSPADSASIISCELIYMANSSQGYYLPVWVFSCTAHMEDGTDGSFDIYVDASK